MIEAIRELDKIEEEYLSLFTGKRIIRKHAQTYHFVPGYDVDNDRTVMVRFSDTVGFINARESGGTPILLELTDDNKTRALNLVAPSIRQKINYVIYRVPDQAYARILFGEEVLLDGYLPVYQYGRIVTNP